MLSSAMYAAALQTDSYADPDIARHDVSEDGITWRPYDPELDRWRSLHQRIEFAAPRDERAV